MSLSDVQSLLTAELVRGPKVLSVQVSQETFAELPVNAEGRPLPLSVNDNLIPVKQVPHHRADWVVLIDVGAGGKRIPIRPEGSSNEENQVHRKVAARVLDDTTAIGDLDWLVGRVLDGSPCEALTAAYAAIRAEGGTDKEALASLEKTWVEPEPEPEVEEEAPPAKPAKKTAAAKKAAAKKA
ncbi:hypothetical protein KSP35_10565 [Aquihabitans sp. G128]|uniref:hypothetical protein n=1 Tax=Aquihabitans sp. G128 TaxID=2849779 RepID=UPI001C2449A6|nr:hypothetical protein [Aquihabitans sp. G128]QXC63182.1 hypothetical protein KSP35_10565 [Aquihabitans sp. G128]